jgi:hypothetical protein
MSNDKETIEHLGGSAKVARKLGYTVQRVQNWKERGIPAKVRLARPDMFPIGKAGHKKQRRD